MQNKNMMTIGDIFSIQPVLKKIAGADMPVSTAWKVAGLMRAVNEELKVADALRLQIFEKHGDKDGDNLVVSEEKMASFRIDMDEFMCQPTGVDIIRIPIEHMGDCKLSPTDILSLGKVIKGGSHADV